MKPPGHDTAPSADSLSAEAKPTDAGDSNPAIRLQLGSKKVTKHLLSVMQHDGGTHTKSIICALGALAGYSCQVSARAQAAAQGLVETANFDFVDGADGNRYFSGEPINRLLVTAECSVFELVKMSVRILTGREPDIDTDEIFTHTFKTLGFESFGKPRIPAEYAPHDNPVNYARNFWPILSPIIREFCPNPDHWPLMLGLSVHEIFSMVREGVDPHAAAQLVMESAIPTSMIELPNFQPLSET